MLTTVLLVIAHFALILGSIVLFMLPFYWLYRRARIKKGEPPGESFNHQLERFFGSTYANWLVFFWAMGEALIWFVIPEFLLILLVFMRIQRKRQLLYYDIYGTIAGTLLAFLIQLPERFIDKLPYVQPSMVTQVREWFDNLGIFGLIHQPFSGVPYKVFTHLAPEYGFFFLAFLVFAVMVRISRYFIIYTVLHSMYPFLHKFVYRHYVRLFLAATFIFSVLLLKVYWAYGHI